MKIEYLVTSFYYIPTLAWVETPHSDRLSFMFLNIVISKYFEKKR